MNMDQEEQRNKKRKRRRRDYDSDDSNQFQGSNESYDSYDDEDSGDYDDESDDLERDDTDAGLKRKSNKGQPLKDQVITLDDYMGKVKENSRRKGKYGVTVPKPFKFDMRDQVKGKNIREKKVE